MKIKVSSLVIECKKFGKDKRERKWQEVEATN